MKCKTLLITGLIVAINTLNAFAADDTEPTATQLDSASYVAHQQSFKRPYISLASNIYFSSIHIDGAVACGDNECPEGEKCCEEDGFNWCVPADETCD